MRILGEIGVDSFLSDYWQKRPLLIRQASQKYANILTPDELAGLACEEQVESRLIIENQGNWSLENGPIQEQRFAELPEANWTLLVQSVDQWLPEVYAVLDEFDFLPAWRLDDVMISYASPGGGVGPHFDYYDVFLLQTSGHRRWKLGQECDQKTPLTEGQPLRQIAEFKQTEEFELGPGDMLYIPAGVAHWGTAMDDQCMTWSIGFRAPSAKELLFTAIDSIIDHMPDDIRYRDSLDSLVGHRGEITPAAEQQVEKLQKDAYQSILSPDRVAEAMSDVLAVMATEPRYPELLDVEPWSAEEIERLFEHSAILERNEASRLAFRVVREDVEASRLYINGAVMLVSTELAEAVCAGQMDLSLFESPQGRALLEKLLNAGVYLVEN